MLHELLVQIQGQSGVAHTELLAAILLNTTHEDVSDLISLIHSSNFTRTGASLDNTARAGLLR